MNIGALALGSCLGLGSCSTVDRDPPAECEDDEDCGAGRACLAQGICAPASRPPIAVLGFYFADDAVELELRGCDPEITRPVQGNELRVQKRSSLITNYGLRASEVESVIDNCGGDSCEGGVCDEDALTCTRQTDAVLSLALASRLGLDQLESPQVPYVTVMEEPLPEGELPPPVAFVWPIYETEDESEHPALRLRVAPPPETAKRNSYWRVIADDAPTYDPEDPDSVIDSSGLVRCQRALLGNEGTVRTLAGTAIGDAKVDFSYAEIIATPSTVIGTPPGCASDEECRPGWACNLSTQTCGLDMRGIAAGSTNTLSEPPGLLAPAYLYTYCEGIVASDDPLLRQFRVKVTPPTTSGLPTVNYALTQGFLDPILGGSPEVNIEDVDGNNGLCLPNWSPPQTVSFAVEGTPVALTETEAGVYACCATDCLPSPELEMPAPPPTVETCASFQSARFETRWSLTVDEQTQWTDNGCIPTDESEDGSSGVYLGVAACEDEQGCSVELTPGNPELDDTRAYTVTIVQPATSVFRTHSYPVTIDATTTELPTFELQPRVLVTGKIQCSGSTPEKLVTDDCDPTSATIAAERLRVDTDEASPLGPFFFEARVDASGSFVMPVDPGLYVLTAFPAVGRPGAPSTYRIVDLREDQLIEVDGVPRANLSDPFELEDGTLVRVQLRDFPISNTKVLPFDTGSWEAQSGWEGYDLNDPQTCHGTGGARGCEIRRLRPNNTPIPLLLDGRFEFTTRDRGAVDCE